MAKLDYSFIRGQLYTNKRNGQLSLVLSKKDIKENKELVQRLNNDSQLKHPRVVIHFWNNTEPFNTTTKKTSPLSDLKDLPKKTILGGSINHKKVKP